MNLSKPGLMNLSKPGLTVPSCAHAHDRLTSGGETCEASASEYNPARSMLTLTFSNPARAAACPGNDTDMLELVPAAPLT